MYRHLYLYLVMANALISMAVALSPDSYDSSSANRLIAHAYIRQHETPPLVAHAFGSNMVLHADGATLFGNAAPAANVDVHVVLDSSGAVVTSTQSLATGSGSWLASVNVPASSYSYSIIVNSSGQVSTLTNVLFGDVYLCSGQSNMDFCLGGLGVCAGGTFAANETVAKAHLFPEIRLLKTGSAWTPSWNGNLSDMSQRVLRDFSAVCYLTAVALKETVSSVFASRPMGLIQASVGGTIIEAWSPAAVARECGMPEAQSGGPTVCAAGPVQTYETLFDASIAPLVPMRLSAAFWYQGETNVDCNGRAGVLPGYYACMLQGMASAWRAAFGQSFPFHVVELAAFNQTDPTSSMRGEDTTVALRKAQATAVHALSRAGLALAMDLGDDGSLPYTPPTPRHGGIHPRNKTEVARRLALAHARVIVPNVSAELVTTGPVPSAVSIDGETLRIDFAAGLSSQGLALVETAQCHSHAQLDPAADCCEQDAGSNAAGMPFEVLLKDGTSYEVVAARVSGARSVELLLTHNGEPPRARAHVVGVRYGWQGYPLCVLRNGGGLPADMFSKMLL